MIRVLSSAPPASTPPQIQTDYYIPLKVRIPRESGEVPSYWRTGDFLHSLVEAGLDPKSGRLVTVTVTLVHAEHTPEAPTAPAPRPGEPGYPILDLARVHGHFTDDPGPVLLHLGPDFVWLSFSQDTPHVRELRCDGLRFLIGADDAWLGLVVEGLTAEQMSELRVGIPRV